MVAWRRGPPLIRPSERRPACYLPGPFPPGSRCFATGSPVGHEWSVAAFGATSNFAIPSGTAVIGAQLFIQGMDFLGAGGCADPLLTLTGSQIGVGVGSPIIDLSNTALLRDIYGRLRTKPNSNIGAVE